MVNVITDNASLREFCAALQAEEFIAVDTEFMRERTYYPELCLVQVAGETRAACIDPLAGNLDMTPLYALLANEVVLKVFHACRQDMEIFYYAMHSLPKPVYDTQVAAMVAGFGESVSYETLVGRLLGVAVDKSSRFTDWSKRPLSEKQLAYALDDVLHLREVYQSLQKTLEARGRTHWIEGEIAPLTDPSLYDINPDEVWRKLRARNASPKYLAFLRAAAKWRELSARQRNVPRSRIMKDDTLCEVANVMPADLAGLQAIRGFSMSLKAEGYRTLFAALQEVASMPSSLYPRLPAKPPSQNDVESLLDLLRLLLKKCAADHGIVPRLLADKEELEQLAQGKREGIGCLEGWRHDLFGRPALQLLDGNMGVKADGKGGIAFVAF